jgi:hypothetical protein
MQFPQKCSTHFLHKHQEMQFLHGLHKTTRKFTTWASFSSHSQENINAPPPPIRSVYKYQSSYSMKPHISQAFHQTLCKQYELNHTSSTLSLTYLMLRCLFLTPIQ